jgi:peptide-N4-(N-acetyl-beta-glucosaminyl)asparagine amidase
VRDAASATKRSRCTEGELIHIIREIKALRRKDIDKKERFTLMTEDTR